MDDPVSGRSIYTELSASAPDTADPGETIETRAAPETVDNDREFMFPIDFLMTRQTHVSLGESSGIRPGIYSELGERAPTVGNDADTVLTASVESHDESGHSAELMLISNT